jgi:hypothetical protein
MKAEGSFPSHFKFVFMICVVALIILLAAGRPGKARDRRMVRRAGELDGQGNIFFIHLRDVRGTC